MNLITWRIRFHRPSLFWETVSCLLDSARYSLVRADHALEWHAKVGLAEISTSTGKSKVHVPIMCQPVSILTGIETNLERFAASTAF